MNASTITLTSKAQAVLAVIAAGAQNRDDIAKKMKVSVPTVNGSLTSLKRNGLVAIDDDGGITTTSGALAHLGGAMQSTRTPRTGTKMERARAIFNKYVDKGRQTVLERFRDNVGLTQAGASTYYQTLRSESEMGQLANLPKAKPAAAKKTTAAAKARRKS